MSRLLPNGVVELQCFCGATVTGPEAEAVELYRRHAQEPQRGEL